MIFQKNNNTHIYNPDRKSQQHKKWLTSTYLCTGTCTIPPSLIFLFLLTPIVALRFLFYNFISPNFSNCQCRDRWAKVMKNWWTSNWCWCWFTGIVGKCKNVSSDCIWTSSSAMLLYRVLCFSLASPGHPPHTHTQTHKHT